MNFAKIFLFAVIFLIIGTHAYADKAYKCNRIVIYKDGKPLYVTPCYNEDIIKMPKPQHQPRENETQVFPPHNKPIKGNDSRGLFDSPVIINNVNFKPYSPNSGNVPEKSPKDQVTPKEKNR